jgi:putative ergosteryl-3beta-O-L-aspartate hydrolase
MLLQEGEDLAHRLANPPISKDVRYRKVEDVPHGWDKGPDPRRPPARCEELYKECCQQLKEVLESG